MDLLAIGRAGVDFYSLDYGSSLVDARRFAKYVGGTAANTVVGATRLGLSCALVSRVGDDELGDFVLGFLKAEGVDVKRLRKDHDRKTGVVFAEVSPGRDGRFIFYREKVADLQVTSADLGSGALEGTRALLVTGTGLSASPSLETVLEAERKAKSLGKMVILNLDWRPTLWRAPVTERVSRYRRAMAQADVLVGNDKEYMAATGKGDLQGALGSIKDADSKLIAVTKGEAGSEVWVHGRRESAEGFRVPLMKGLGGGDGFISGFIFGILHGWAPARAALFGNAVGAIVVTGHACSESMPSPRRVSSFLKRNGYDLVWKSGPSKR